MKTLHNILLFLCPGWEEKEKEKKKEKTLGEEIVVHLDKVVQRVGGAILVGNLEKSWLSKFSGFCLLDPVYPPSPRAIEGLFFSLFFFFFFFFFFCCWLTVVNPSRCS